jgi:hypothetical protein
LPPHPFSLPDHPRCPSLHSLSIILRRHPVCTREIQIRRGEWEGSNAISSGSDGGAYAGVGRMLARPIVDLRPAWRDSRHLARHRALPLALRRREDVLQHWGARCL